MNTTASTKNASQQIDAAGQGRSASAASQQSLRWEHESNHWPNSEASFFVSAGGIRWHVQRQGSGPALLLLHGTGASTHSWRDLAPLLAERFTVVALDLPGHGFTEAPPQRQLSLPGMANLVSAVLDSLDFEPSIIVGHSAGAAVGAQLCLNGDASPRCLVSLNGALLPLAGFAGIVFLPMAKFLASQPIWARLMANSASDQKTIDRLLERTGSTIDRRGAELYSLLLRDSDHTAAALAMMANWDLKTLQRRLPLLECELTLVVGKNDQMIPCEQADLIKRYLPEARIESYAGYGHLVHEEAPEQISELIASLASESVEEAPR